MMVSIGNFLFRYRNALFPILCLPLFIPARGVFESYPALMALGLAISLTGQTIRVLTIGLAYIIRGGQDRKVYAKNLVTEGIFNHCRNPLYVGNVLVIIGLGVMSNSPYGLFVLGPVFVFCYQCIVLAEENFLRGKFAEEFEDYTRRVNRWIPDPRGLAKTMSRMEFNWRRVLVKEYGSTYIWTTTAVVIAAKNYYTYQQGARFHASLPCLVATLVVLLIGYITVRTLKKSGRLKG